MLQIHSVGGMQGGEAFLLVGHAAAFLVDAGFAFSGAKTVQNIEKVLGARPLDYILLTHSHYDHVAGSVRVKQRYPGAQIVASETAKGIFEKQNARRLMQELDDGAAAAAGMPPCPGYTNRLAADIATKDGDVLRAGSTEIRVIATPGHTKCCQSFYFEKEGLLAASETTGVSLDAERVVPCFIVGYGMAQGAVEQMRALAPAGILIPHSQAVWGDAAQAYWERAYRANEGSAAFIAEKARQGLSLEEIAQAYKNWIYYGPYVRSQPEAAFMINTRAMIPRLLEELGVQLPT